VLLTIPPTIGAAIRFITLAPVPLDHMIGNNPAMIAVTDLTLGPNPSTPPSITASYSSRRVGECPSRIRACHAWSR